MQVEKLVIKNNGVNPLIASLPIRVSVGTEESRSEYDPRDQVTISPNSAGYSTSREDDSAGGIFSTKSDTKRDD